MTKTSRKKLPVINLDELKEKLDYDADTGKFTWIEGSGRAKAGSQAGFTKPDGTRAIRINDKIYAAHYLAWYIVHGDYPAPRQLQHISEDRDDNRIENLELRSSKEIAKEKKKRKKEDAKEKARIEKEVESEGAFSARVDKSEIKKDKKKKNKKKKNKKK